MERYQQVWDCRLQGGRKGATISAVANSRLEELTLSGSQHESELVVFELHEGTPLVSVSSAGRPPSEHVVCTGNLSLQRALTVFCTHLLPTKCSAGSN